jgi:hypothetical protein
MPVPDVIRDAPWCAVSNATKDIKLNHAPLLLKLAVFEL